MTRKSTLACEGIVMDPELYREAGVLNMDQALEGS